MLICVSACQQESFNDILSNMFLQEVFVQKGGSLLEHHKVEQIQPGSSVKVTTSRGVLTAPQVVITAGVCACVYMFIGTLRRVRTYS